MAYENKYLDGAGLAILWEKIKNTFSTTDTTNTAGSSADTADIYIVGSKTQSSDATKGTQTYTNSKVKISGGTVKINTSGTTWSSVLTSADKTSTAIAAASTDTGLVSAAQVATFVEGKGYKTTDNDTKNTAGSTNSTSDLFIIGAGSQAANPQTYSNAKVKISGGTVKINTSSTSTATWSSVLTTADKDTSITLDSTSTNVPTSAAVAGLVSSSIAAADAMIYKGTIATSGATVSSLPNTTAKVGWTYKVAEAGYIKSDGSFVTTKPTSGTYMPVENGDMVICLTAGSTSTAATWSVVQANIDGAVTHSNTGTITSNAVAVFDGTNKSVVKASSYTIAASVPSDAKFTDSYVNSASFADDSTNKNLKMTLTRAGSDTSTVTANIPSSTSSRYGVVKVSTGLTSTDGVVTVNTLTTDEINAILV